MTLLLLLPLLCAVLPVCLYLLLLTVAAPFGAATPAPRLGPLRSLAVIVPAHNEQQVLGRLLESLAALTYPRDRFDVVVVADNCTDRTAAIARLHGADVFERFNTREQGKGQALRWLFGELQRRGRRYDGYVILDADSVVSPNFLLAMNDRLQAGALAVQAYYTVLPLHGSRAECLREAALALVHFLRPAAKMALGASAGLKGNGMCFHRSLIERFGWPSAGLAEDVEFHLQLVAAGVRVVFAPEAVVRSEMPASLARSRSQNARWEAGRLTTVRRQALPLLWLGIRRRSAAAIDAAVEQLVPPLSVPVALAAAWAPIGLLLGHQSVTLAAVLALAVLGLYILAGLLLARVRLAVYLALLHAPVYIGWKVLLYADALLSRRSQPWVRTERG